jgi:hypothetical protein
LHATNHAALRDENIISQLHSLLLKETLGACAGRFILDVGQTGRTIRSYIKVGLKKRLGKDSIWHVLHW